MSAATFLVLCGLLLLAAIALVASAGAASGGAVVASTPGPPPALAVLEQKMEGLQIHSERWEEAYRVRSFAESGGETCEHGRCSRHVSKVPVSQGARLIGLSGGDPPEGEFSAAGEEGRSGYIVYGSNLYIWVPSSCAPGRPWITAPLPAGAVSPIGGPFPDEQDPHRLYGALIAALAASRVTDLGPRTVAGQPVTAFLAIRSVPAHTPPVGFAAALHLRPRRVMPRVTERLEVFINAEGVPLRVVARKGSSREGIVVVTTVLAVNLPQPLGIQAPPADRTRPESNGSCASEGSTK